jgi:hypothetical protein
VVDCLGKKRQQDFPFIPLTAINLVPTEDISHIVVNIIVGNFLLVKGGLERSVWRARDLCTETYKYKEQGFHNIFGGI